MTGLPALLLVSLLLPFYAEAEEKTVDTRHWEVGADVALTDDYYMPSFSIAFWGNRFFGAKLSLGWAEELDGLNLWDFYNYWVDDGYDTDEDYYYEETDYYARFIASVSVPVRYPRIFNFYDGDLALGLQAEPGLLFSPPGDGTQCLFWNLRLGLTATVIDHLVISAGYFATNYDLYSGIKEYDSNGRPLVYRGKDMFNGFMLAVSYSF